MEREIISQEQYIQQSYLLNTKKNKIKAFLDKHKLIEFTTTSPALQEKLEGALLSNTKTQEDKQV